MPWTYALALVTGYVALDWVSFIHPLHGLNITPWSPAPALGLCFIMRFGVRALGPLVLAVVLGDVLIRDLPLVSPATFALAGVQAVGLGVLGEVMRRQIGDNLMFENRTVLLRWVLIVVLGTLVMSAAFVGTLALLGMISVGSLSEAIARHWVGDGVGTLVTMPLIGMLMDDRGRALLRHVVSQWSALFHVGFTLIGLWIAFGLGGGADSKYFYVLFLPIVWAAARQGLVGAVLSAALIQCTVIGVVLVLRIGVVTVLEIQTLAVVLVMVGFFVGVIVDEQRRMSAELRHSLRLAAAGEMAGAIAHELNQPLTAMAAYGNACEDLINQGERGDRLLGAVSSMVAESRRTAEVVRRLRDFFQTGATNLETVELRQLLAGAAGPFRFRADRDGVELSLACEPAITLLADRLQIEVVIRNLLANAFDAVTSRPPQQRSIRVDAAMGGPDRVCICVEDSGPGLASAAVGRLFEPFHSTKSSGLGLGLAISRAIAEAHGGRLWAEVHAHGVFRLELPVEWSPAGGKS